MCAQPLYDSNYECGRSPDLDTDPCDRFLRRLEQQTAPALGSHCDIIPDIMADPTNIIPSSAATINCATKPITTTITALIVSV